MNTSVAVLGLPSSGKTALIDSFDHNKGLFEPKIVIEPMTAAMPDVEDSIASEQRNYQISIEDKEKHFLSITEYPGDLLTKREENANLREVMIHSMMNKSSWIIMIDGAWFQSNEEDEIEKIIRKNYARIVVPLVSAYADAHEGQAPDIMFVASKVSEYLLPYLNEEGKNKFGRIVESAFGGLVSDTMQPLILLSDTSLKTAVVAIESLIYLQYKEETEKETKDIHLQMQTLASRRSQLTTKLNTENGKMLKSKSVIQDLEQQIQGIRQEEKSLSAQLRDPAKDLSMRNFGISLHRLMLRNKAMLAGGFDRVRYTYDESTEEGYFQTYWQQKIGKVNIIVGLVLFGVIALLSLTHSAETRTNFVQGIVGGVLWALIALFIKHPIAKILGILGIAGGAIMAFGTFGIPFLILYVIWVIISYMIADSLENKRAIRLGIPKKTRYKDELVRFYDEAVRKG